MAKRLLDADLEDVHLHHVRMAFSKENDEVGIFRAGKVLHMFYVILQIYIYRFRYGIETLYYPPSGPKQISIYRDLFILISTRWLFRHTIFHMHASGVSELIPTLNPVLQQLCRWAYFRPSAVMRLSEYTPDDATGLQAEREYLVEGASDDDYLRFKDLVTAQRPGKVKFFYMGTLCEEKGILDLLNACGELKRQDVDFQLDVAGSYQPPEFADRIAATIEQEGLADNVIVHGQVLGDAKFHLLAKADIFCFPSYYPCESFPCVVIEAMCFKLPVVSTRWRGIKNMVQQGRTGFLSEIRDVPALVANLKTLCDDPALRAKMGEAGRASFLKNYTTERHVRVVQSVFLEVAGGKVQELPECC